MIGRLRYYFSKLVTRTRTDGFFGSIREVGSFLVRRKFFLQFFSEWLEYQVFSRFRDLDATTIKIFIDKKIGAPKVLLYASYDAQSLVRPHVVQQLRFFKAQGYDVVWVSNSPVVNAIEFKKIEDCVTVGIHRKNEGYDFASWAVAYRTLPPLRFTSIIIMNDSCFGPEFDFGPQLKRMESASEAAFGITKSYEIREYLQSYFIHFGESLIASGIAKNYFDRIRILNSKWGIVRFFEIGGSKFLAAHAVKLEALIDPKTPAIAEKMNELHLSDPVLNPVGKLWVAQGLNPFHKRSADAAK